MFGEGKGVLFVVEKQLIPLLKKPFFVMYALADLSVLTCRFLGKLLCN